MTEITELVRRYGSPLYIYELEAVERAHADLRAILPAPSVLYYSLKANPHPLIARTLRESGCRAEVSSDGELTAALAAGFTPASCFYTGPGKTDSEIQYALRCGVRRFSVESANELHRVGRAALSQETEADVLLRVNGTATGASGLRMTGTPTQFGVDEDQVLENPEKYLRIPGTNLMGLHLFPISNARDEASLLGSIQESIALAARLRDKAGLPMQAVDLGGGFAAPYARAGRRPAYPGLLEAVEAHLDAHLPNWRTGQVEVAFESGRYLVGDCGRLAARVQDVKHSKEQSFVVLDTGIHHLGGLTGLGRMGFPTAVPETGDADATERVTFVGPLCTPADVLGRGVETSGLELGSQVVFPNTGAYGLTASLIAFLGRPTPAEVVLRGGELISVTQLRLSQVPLTDAATG